MYTGTLLHVDPQGTDAFNAVLVGHKWWVVLPKDIYEFDNELSCEHARSCVQEAAARDQAAHERGLARS